VVLGGSPFHEEVGGIAKSDNLSRLCSTVIAADHSAGIEGENWDETVVCPCDGPSFLVVRDGGGRGSAILVSRGRMMYTDYRTKLSLSNQS